MGQQARDNKMEEKNKINKKDEYHVHLLGLQKKLISEKRDKNKQGGIGIT